MHIKIVLGPNLSNHIYKATSVYEIINWKVLIIKLYFMIIVGLQQEKLLRPVNIWMTLHLVETLDCDKNVSVFVDTKLNLT